MIHHNVYLDLLDQARKTFELLVDLRKEYADANKNARYIRLEESYINKLKHIKKKLEKLGTESSIIEITFTNENSQKSVIYFTSISLEIAQLLFPIYVKGFIPGRITYKIITPGEINIIHEEKEKGILPTINNKKT